MAVIDTQVNQMMARRLRDAIRTITDKPILYAINTHYQPGIIPMETLFSMKLARRLSLAR